MVASADLAFDFSGVWLCPADATLSSGWLVSFSLNQETLGSDRLLALEIAHSAAL